MFCALVFAQAAELGLDLPIQLAWIDFYTVIHSGIQHDSGTLKVKFNFSQIGAVDTPWRIAVNAATFVGLQADHPKWSTCSGDTNFSGLIAFEVDVIGVFDKAGRFGNGHGGSDGWTVCLRIDGR